MDDYKLTFQERCFTKIDKYYHILTGAEKDQVMFLKNMAEKHGKLENKYFNQLNDLAISLDKKIPRNVLVR